jgi:hypothetical protein
MQPGDVAVFYFPGGNPLQGYVVTDALISADGGSMTASVPYLPTDLQYLVAVVNLSTSEIRFQYLGFYVVA